MSFIQQGPVRNHPCRRYTGHFENMAQRMKSPGCQPSITTETRRKLESFKEVLGWCGRGIKRGGGAGR